MSKIITIDGPTSSGKSTVGFLLSQRINYIFIDTGSIYRAGALKILNSDISIYNQQKCADVFRKLNIKVEGHKIYLDKEEVTDILHSRDITTATPIIASYKEVREECKKIQRQLASKQDTVLTGRDVGSEVFPEANLKFYVTASAEVRARRRFDQQKEKRPEISLSQILEEIIQRDRMDETREVSPSRIPDHAVIVDTSNMDIDQTVNALLQWVQR